MSSVLSISLDKQNRVEVRFNWDEGSMISMLGWIDVAKAWLLDRMKKCWNVVCDDYRPNEVDVWKSDAILHYVREKQVIDSRLEAIKNSDDDQLFKIPSILSE